MKQEPSDLVHVFAIILLVIGTVSALAYKFFGFEISIIITLVLGITTLMTGLVGVENIIINKR